MKNSLTNKIIFILFVLSFILCISTVYFYATSQRDTLHKIFIERAQASSRALTTGIRAKEDINNQQRLLSDIQKNMWLDPEIASISISSFYSGELVIFASSDFDSINQKSDSDNLESFNQNKEISKIVESSSGDFLKVITPIYISGQKSGVVHIDYTLENIDRAINNAIFSLVGIFIIFVLLFLLIIYIFLNSIIIKPLGFLVEQVGKISEGDLHSRIKVSSEDEIGDLAVAFNTMTSKLQTLYTEMDDKIQEKTSELSLQVVEKERSKAAILNLLEDIDAEKKKVDGIVIERTKELYAEKARLVSSINSLSFGIMIADINNNILFKNKALTKLFGLQEDSQVSIDNVFELLGEHFNVKAQIEMCLRGRKVCEIKEIAFGAKFLRGIVAPVMTDKEMIGYVFLLEDITETRVLERSKEEFFAVASHELRTPLTAIRGNAEMILDMYADKVADKDVREMLADIKQASVRLIGIVNDFLDASRLEQGKLSIVSTKFDVVEIIEKVVKSLNETAIEKKLTLEFKNKGEKPIMVLADKDKVEQVLFNLIGNSIKFTSKGGVTISADFSGSFVKISVKDTGVGISLEGTNLLFRKFQPAGEQILARDVTKSTGLGLYISRLLVSKMGGTIGLEKSSPGEGSTFAFTLPIAS